MKEDNDTHIIIQARMGSTRLPGKVLLPFTGGFNFLEWVVERAKTSEKATRVIIATTRDKKDDAIEELCKKHGYEYFRGSENDVLERYFETAKKFGSRIIIRVTSDNPLVDIKEMDRAIEILEQQHLDYVTTHSAELPLGAGAEVFSFAAIGKVVREANDPYEHEHVTPYFYRHKELFNQSEITPVRIHPFAQNVRLTLDTPEDLKFLNALAIDLQLSDPSKQPSTDEILSYLEVHPELVKINQSIIQKTFPK